jgi:hypothetical protein
MSGPPTQSQGALADVLGLAINSTKTISLRVVSGNSEVLVGDYLGGRIDIQDLATAGPKEPAGSASLLAHEIAEQTAKQGIGLEDNIADYSDAHSYANIAQTAVSGFFPGGKLKVLPFNTGIAVTPHSSGTKTVVVTLVWFNGNLIKVLRR